MEQVRTEFVLTGAETITGKMDAMATASKKLSTTTIKTKGILGTLFDDATKHVTSFSAFAAAGAAGWGFKGLLSGAIEHLKNVKNIQNATGEAVQAAEGLTMAFAGAKVEASEASRIILMMSSKALKSEQQTESFMTKMSQRQGKIMPTMNPQLQAFKMLGVNIQNGVVPAFIQLSELVKNGTVDMTKLRSSFGIKSTDIGSFYNMLKKGPEYLKEQLVLAKKYGIANSENMDYLKKYSESQRKINQNWNRIKLQIGAGLLPIAAKLFEGGAKQMDKWVNYAMRFGKTMSEFLREHLALILQISKILIANAVLQKVTPFILAGAGGERGTGRGASLGGVALAQLGVSKVSEQIRKLFAPVGAQSAIYTARINALSMSAIAAKNGLVEMMANGFKAAKNGLSSFAASLSSAALAVGRTSKRALTRDVLGPSVLDSLIMPRNRVAPVPGFLRSAEDLLVDQRRFRFSSASGMAYGRLRGLSRGITGRARSGISGLAYGLRARGGVRGLATLGLASIGSVAGKAWAWLPSLVVVGGRLGSIIWGLTKLSLVGAAIVFVIQGVRGFMSDAGGHTSRIKELWERIKILVESTSKHFEAGSLVHSFFMEALPTVVEGLLMMVERIAFYTKVAGEYAGGLVSKAMEGYEDAQKHGTLGIVGSLKYIIQGKGGPSATQAYDTVADEYERKLERFKIKKEAKEASERLRASAAEAMEANRSSAPSETEKNVYNFPNARFDITQKFAEGYDPDRVAVTFARDISSMTQHRLGSNFSMVR